MRVEMFSIPDLAQWTEAYLDAAKSQGVKDMAAANEDAERSFKFYSSSRKWRDENGAKIKFWPRMAETSAVNFAKRQKPGYSAPKHVVHVPDCCFRPVDECDCSTLVYRPERGYHFPEDALKAGMQADQAETAAMRALASLRMLSIEAAVHADQNFIRSSATDRGRGVMELPDKADEYFNRMGIWLEFADAVHPRWCTLADELVMAYTHWLMSRPVPQHDLRLPNEDPWAFITRINNQQS